MATYHPDYTLARAAIRDRMAPLLEPRRGFHPEINRELHRLHAKDTRLVERAREVVA